MRPVATPAPCAPCPRQVSKGWSLLRCRRCFSAVHSIACIAGHYSMDELKRLAWQWKRGRLRVAWRGWGSVRRSRRQWRSSRSGQGDGWKATRRGSSGPQRTPRCAVSEVFQERLQAFSESAHRSMGHSLYFFVSRRTFAPVSKRVPAAVVAVEGAFATNAMLICQWSWTWPPCKGTPPSALEYVQRKQRHLGQPFGMASVHWLKPRDAKFTCCATAEVMAVHVRACPK